MKNSNSSSGTIPALFACTCLLVGLGLQKLAAATISKADNLDTLNLGTSWAGGQAPGSSDTALFDSTLSAANTSLTLGADLSWLGLQLTSPGAPVTINAGNTLTLGASGIDMSSASQSLSLGCGVTLGTGQTWNVGLGATFTNAGLLAGSGPLVKTGPGTFAITVSSNTFTGGTFLAGGTNVIASVANGHFGAGSVTLSNGATLMLLSGNSGDPGGGGGAFTNTLVIPAGQIGTLLNHWRGTCSGPVTGGGTLNLRVNGVRGEWTANWSGFTGQVNVTTRTGADDFRINIGGTTNLTGFSNCVVNLSNGAIMYQSANPPNGGATASTTFQPIGALTGSGATLSGNLVAGRFVNWQIGFLNTDSTFAGRIADNTGAARITKVGTGSLTLSGTNSYTGATAILNGKLVQVTGGSASNSLSTTANAGATFGVLVSPNGTRWVGTNLLFANGSSLEMNFGGSTPSTTIAPLFVRGNLSLTNTVNVLVKGGNWAVGAYPLVQYDTITNGGGFAALTLTVLPSRVIGVLSNDTVNKMIDLVVTATTQPLNWATGNGVWDTTTSNWKDSASVSTTYQESGGFGDSVQFEDSQSIGSPITVTLNTTVVPVGASVNASKNYTISGSGSIAGFGSLTKTGSGTLTLSTINTFSGGANINGGILNFSTLGNLGSPAIKFGGGTLQYASGNSTDISVRIVTFNAGGGTIDTAGNNVTFSNAVGNGGTGGLTKTGAGTLTLNGANSYFGNTVVNQGALAWASGAGISNSAALIVNSGAFLDGGVPGIILNGAVNQILAGSGSVNPITVPNNTTISPGTNGVAATLTVNSLTLNGGTIAFDISTNVSGRDQLVVQGNMAITSGTLQLLPSTFLTNGTYELFHAGDGITGVGNLLVTGFSQPGQIAFLSDAVFQEIDLIVATGGTNSLVWSGTGGAWDVGISADWLNGGNPSVFNQGDGVTFNDTGAASPSVSLASAIYPSNVTVSGSASYTLQDGSGVGAGKLIGPTLINKSGAGALTVLTVNNNTGPTVINGGSVQFGNGSTTGAPGTGNITNNGAVIFAQPDDRTINGIITGTGSVVQQGAATLTLTKDSPYAGGTTISSGTLQVGVGAAAGSIGTGPVTNAGTLIFNRSGSFTVANGIKGSGAPSPAALIKLGTGTMTLGGVNTYEGNTYISNGVVKLGAAEAIPDGGATTGWLILDAGTTAAGTFDLNGFNETVNALSGLGGAALGQIVNNASGTTNRLTINGANTTTYSGLIRDNTGSGGAVAVTITGGGIQRFEGGSSYSAGTVLAAGTLELRNGLGAGTGPIIISNSATLRLVTAAGNVSVFPGNTITTPAGETAIFTSDNLANGLSGNFISGDGASTNSFAGPISISTPNVKQFSNFVGTVVIPDGFQLRFSSTTLSVNGGDNTTFVLGSGSTLNTRNGTGAAAGNGIYLGALLGVGTIGGAGNADGASTYIIGGKGIDCTFDGALSGTAPRGSSLVKVGAGMLTLDGTLSYDGATIVSNGVLALAGSANLDSVTNPVAIRAGAFLDVSAMPSSTLTLGNLNPQALTGSGTLRGALVVNNNSTIAPGDSTGILTVTNTASVAGTFSAQLNRTNTPNSSRLAAQSITLSPGAILMVTNIGPGLRFGDTFQLLSGPITGTFTTTTLPALSPCLSWDVSALYTSGTISVSGSICPPTLTSVLVSSNSLQLSWPSSYVGAGWFLQAQTNSILVGISTNWITVAGSDATNQVFMPVSRTNGCVFYRLVYP
jgi:autotransporter-associated beta strand protein